MDQSTKNRQLSEVIDVLQGVSQIPFENPHDITNYCKNVNVNSEYVSLIIRRELEKRFGDVVFNKVKNCLDIDSPLKMLKNLETDITFSSEFSDLSIELSTDIFQHLSPSAAFEGDIMTDRRLSMPTESTFSCDDGSLNSINDSYYFLCDKRQYGHLSENLLPKNHTDVRILNLKKLCNLATNDLVSHEVWLNSLKRNLRLCLGDGDEHIFNQALLVHVKLLSSILPFVVQEGFINLHLFLKGKLSFKHHMNMPKSISCANPAMKNYLKIFRVLNDSFKNLTQCWIRYHDSCSLIIINSCLDLLNVNFPLRGNSHTFLSPYHLFALTDPSAEWFSAWLSSFHGQELFTRVISDNNKWLLNLFLLISKSLKTLLRRNRMQLRSYSRQVDVSVEEDTYYHSHIKHLRFIHGLRIVMEILYYEKTSATFFELFGNTKTSLAYFFQNLVLLVQKLRCFCLKEKSDLCPASIVAVGISLALKNELTWTDRYHILEDILIVIENVSADCEINLQLFHFLDIFDDILKRKKLFLDLASVMVNGKNGLVIVLGFLDDFLKAIIVADNDLMEPEMAFLKLVFKISATFFDHPASIDYIDKHCKFHISFVQVFWKFFPLWKTSIESHDMCFEICKVVCKLMSTEIGIATLQAISFLDDAVEAILSTNNRLEPEVDFSWLASNFYTFPLLISSTYIGILASQMFENDQFCDDDSKPRLWILQNIFPTIYFIPYLSKYDPEMSSSSLSAISPLIHGVGDFHILKSNEELTLVTLSIVNILVSSLHLSFHLQRNFNIIDKLLKAQAEYCIDQMSWLRNHILSRMLVIGGPNERKIPPISPTEVTPFIQCMLMCKFKEIGHIIFIILLLYRKN